MATVQQQQHSAQLASQAVDHHVHTQQHLRHMVGLPHSWILRGLGQACMLSHLRPLGAQALSRMHNSLVVQGHVQATATTLSTTAAVVSLSRQTLHMPDSHHSQQALSAAVSKHSPLSAALLLVQQAFRSRLGLPTVQQLEPISHRAA
jgi:hypothetical protein